MAIYLLEGVLPWQGVTKNNNMTKVERYRAIRDKKQDMNPDELCKEIPNEFSTYLKMVKALKF